jgi:hypothetical protein
MAKCQGEAGSSRGGGPGLGGERRGRRRAEEGAVGRGGHRCEGCTGDEAIIPPEEREVEEEADRTEGSVQPEENLGRCHWGLWNVAGGKAVVFMAADLRSGMRFANWNGNPREYGQCVQE